MEQNNQNQFNRQAKEVILRVLLIIITSYIFIDAQGDNILSLNTNAQIKQLTNTIFMESFGFFTKNPKSEEAFSIYKISKEGIFKLNLRNNSGYNLYGWSRKNRVRLLEIGNIAQAFGDELWNKTNTVKFHSCILKSADTLDFHKHDLKLKVLTAGKYIVTKDKLIPWEWNKIKSTKEIQYVVVHIKNNGV